MNREKENTHEDYRRSTWVGQKFCQKHQKKKRGLASKILQFFVPYIDSFLRNIISLLLKSKRLCNLILKTEILKTVFKIYFYIFSCLYMDFVFIDFQIPKF